MNTKFLHTTLIALSLALISSLFVAESAAQEISSAQKGQLAKISYLVNQGGELFKEKKFERSARRIRSAQSALTELASGASPAVIKALEKDYDRIAKARKLLIAKGEEFDELQSLKALAASESAATANVQDSEAASKEEVSFLRHVAPIVVQHCASCHIDQSKGRYSAATYVSLKSGTRKGLTVKPRDLANSRLITLIEQGAMPPRGEVPAEQLDVLKKWIEQGAKFDGTKKQQQEPLTDLVAKQPGSTGAESESAADQDSRNGTQSGRGRNRNRNRSGNRRGSRG